MEGGNGAVATEPTDLDPDYRRLVEGITDYAVFLISPEGRIVSWNPGAERMLGYTSEEAIGQPVAFVFTPEDRANGVPEREMATAAAVGRADDKRWHLRKDGSRVYVDGVMTRLDGADGALAEFGKVMRDATERLAASREIEQARNDLELRVQDRTRELAAVNAALESEITERNRTEEARRDLFRRLDRAQEEERRRISRELHDEMGQHLTALHFGFRALLEACGERSAVAGTVGKLDAIAIEVGKVVHRIAVELRPTALDDLGLTAALSNYVEEWSAHTGIPADLHCGRLAAGDSRLPPNHETTIYRMVQEALTNISKHASASNVSVIVEARVDNGGGVVAIVEDDGVGIDNEALADRSSAPHLGLRGMRERADLAGGSLEIESGPGRGTTLFLRLPPALGD
jgi:PAS domain S-box-containing protein